MMHTGAAGKCATEQIAGDAWNRLYGREGASRTGEISAKSQTVFGDRNPVCSCLGMENYS